MSAEIKNILYHDTSPNTETEGCSDILLNSPDLKLIVHNEDCDPLVKPYGYIVNATIDDAEGHEQFMSYCYPGILPGNNFTVNGFGMIITVNGLFPDKVTIGVPPGYFLNRSIIRIADITDGKRLLENAGYGSSYAFCANIAPINDPENMYSIEIGRAYPKSNVHIHTIPEGTREEPNYYFRCNKYKHLGRAAELPKPKPLKDVLEILGDTQYQLYPIYRTTRETDAGETVNTASVDVIKRTVGIYYENPKYAKSPFLTLPLYLN